MLQEISKLCRRAIILSIVLYFFLFILTPLKLEIMPYLGVLAYSVVIVLVCSAVISVIRYYVLKK